MKPGALLCVLVASVLIVNVVNGRPKRCRPLSCNKMLKPVCGTDGKTYSNECILRIVTCKSGGKIKLDSRGPCGGSGNKSCDRPCPAIYLPVCGTDGKTYGNKCALDAVTCKSGGKIRLASLRPCRPRRRCNRPCPRIYKPVCGTDGKTYSNKCTLDVASCKAGGKIKMASTGRCGAPGKRCDRPCPRIYKPVCGTDGKTYSNKCTLDVASCKANGKIKMAYPRRCGRPNCLRPCFLLLKPVCGSDGKTYANKCQLEVAACKSRKQIRVVHQGECRGTRGQCGNFTCTNPPNSRCREIRNGKPVCTCSFGCSRIYTPVCASDRRTYSNVCVMERASCLRKRVIRVVKKGRCGPPSGGCRMRCRRPATCKLIFGRYRCVPPTSTCKRCPWVRRRPRRPVCGSDGRTYPSECHLKYQVCRYKRRITVRSQGPCSGHGRCGFRCRGPNKECKIINRRPTCVTKHRKCPKACPRLYRPVCGTNGQTYSNKCILDRNACKDPSIRISRWGPCKGGENRRCGTRCRGIPYSSCVTEKGKSTCQCPKLCPRIVFPVCGSDNRNYPNRCALRRKACTTRTMITIKKPFRCPDKGTKCRMVCPKVYRPVCGSDGKTYPNQCVMKSKACEQGRNITVARQGRCPRNTKCRLGCPRVYRPVCGSDGKTYPNLCVMKAKACEQGKNITVARQGRCPRSTECRMVCPMVYRPVCGSDGKTYPNLCVMKNKACKEGRNITVARQGKCQKANPCKGFTCTNPPFSMCQVMRGKPKCVCPRFCTMEYMPVCDQDGKQYGNRCGLRVASCQKRRRLKETPCPKRPQQ